MFCFLFLIPSQSLIIHEHPEFGKFCAWYRWYRHGNSLLSPVAHCRVEGAVKTVSMLEIQKYELGVSRKRNVQFCFEESGKLSILLQVRCFEDAYEDPQFGERKCSLISWMLLCGLFILKVLILHLSCRNQEHVFDDLLKIAMSHTCQLCVASDNNNT